MKKLLFLALTFILMGCNFKPKNGDVLISNDTEDSIFYNTSDTLIIPGEAFEKWSSLKEVPKKWMNISPHAMFTAISIDNGYISLYDTSDRTNTLSIDKITRAYNSTGLFISAMNDSTKAQFDVRILNKQNSTFEWNVFLNNTLQNNVDTLSYRMIPANHIQIIK